MQDNYSVSDVEQKRTVRAPCRQSTDQFDNYVDIGDKLYVGLFANSRQKDRQRNIKQTNRKTIITIELDSMLDNVIASDVKRGQILKAKAEAEDKSSRTRTRTRTKF